MTFEGRRVVLAPTEPVPTGMRLSPGVIMVTAREFRALERGDPPTQFALQTIIHDIERAELRDRLAAEKKRK